jgi:hypothetical protein
MVPMIARLAVVCGVMIGAVGQVSAQDPTKTLPDAYRVQFENDHVRVVRVHYPAGAKLPEHTHPGGTTVYVYLNDSEGVVFRHSGRSNRAVTRPPVKAGSVRIATGPEEDHTAENPASTPSEFLRILLKTAPSGQRTTFRFARGAYPANEDVVDEQFSNKQLRITRLLARSVAFEAPANAPALVVSVPDGSVRWVPSGERFVADSSNSRAEVLRIDFLSSPR